MSAALKGGKQRILYGCSTGAGSSWAISRNFRHNRIHRNAGGQTSVRLGGRSIILAVHLR